MAEAAGLFSPLMLGTLALANRFVMAPMSRNRANAVEAAPALAIVYYRQRASAGLILVEATPVSLSARNSTKSPGIRHPHQVEAWAKVTAAVHADGGKIFLQLAHSGRTEPEKPLPADPGPGDFIVPEALSRTEIEAIIDDFGAAAQNASEAGFDGVEIHAGNGYLIDRFLRTGSNRRGDSYGGPANRRIRLLVEIIESVSAAWDRNRIGVKLSPASAHNGASDGDPQRSFGRFAALLSGMGLAYLHATEASDCAFDWPGFRARYRGVYIANGGYDRARAMAAIASGYADLVSLGVAYIANPDLVERFRANAPLNLPDKTRFFGGDHRGYTDYPTMAGRA